MAAVTSAVIIGASVAYQASEAEDAEDRQHAARQEQAKANRIQRAEQSAKDAAQKRKMIREDRIRKANILAGSEQAGITASSSVFGTQSGETTNTSIQTSFAAQTALSADAISARLQEAANLQGEANAINTNAANVANVVRAGVGVAQQFQAPPPTGTTQK